MSETQCQQVLTLVASNTTPKTDPLSELLAIINRAIIANNNASASFYGDFTEADLMHRRDIP